MRTWACLTVAAWLVAACGAGVSSPASTVVPKPTATAGAATSGASPSTAAQPTTGSTTIAPSPSSEETSATPASAVTLTLTSSAFEAGGAIPSRYTCDGKDLSPPLAWAGVPAGTVAFLLTMRDPDADDFLHWIAWNIPATVTSLKAGASGDLPGRAGEGKTDFGGSRRGYRGPCPPSGTHDYVLTLYALPIALADASTTPSSRLEAAAAEIALGVATLRGHYRRH